MSENTSISKTPWHTGGSHSRIIYDAVGMPVADAIVYHGAPDAFARSSVNAARIVACVNACALSSNEALHAVASTPYATLPIALANVTTARDRLAALEPALQAALAAMSAGLDQISQMRGLFPDDDGAIQNAVDALETASDQAEAVLLAL